MAIMIREDMTSSQGVEVIWNYSEPIEIKEKAITTKKVSPTSIMVDYEALHVGMTRNNTYYTKEAIESSVPTWVSPYLRPVIMHHNEENGKIIGRIHHSSVAYKGTLSGTPALMLTANIPDAEGIEHIKDGRLITTSVGAISTNVECSICHLNIAEYGDCGHERGAMYDNVLCYWIFHEMEAKELSYVIVPSDIYSQHVKIYDPNTKKELSITESTIKKGEITMSKENTNVEGNNLEDKIKQLEAELLEKQKEIDELDSKLKETEKKAITAEEELQKANEDIELAKQTIVVKEAAINKEIKMREALESQILSDKLAKRTEMIDSIVHMREKLGKRIVTKESFLNRTDDFLKESLLDLQHEISNKNTIDINITESNLGNDKPVEVKNPGIIETSEAKEKKNVKEEKAISNISVEEAFAGMMSAMMIPNKNCF